MTKRRLSSALHESYRQTSWQASWQAFRQTCRQVHIPAMAYFGVASALVACATTPPSSGYRTEEPGDNGTEFVPKTPVSPNGGDGVYGDSTAPSIPACSPCEDFPKAPIFDGNVSRNVAAVFEKPSSGGVGPCVLEPEEGSLFPSNWLRPRFRYAPAGAARVFEIRMHSDNQIHDLVVYTESTSWTMPKDMWAALSKHTEGKPVTVTIRSSDGESAPDAPVKTSFSVAPVEAKGSMVFWATRDFDQNIQNTKLQGFRVGDESVVDALTTNLVRQKVRATWGSSLKDQTTQVQCIGCHTSTPDGKYAAFTAQWPWPNAIASVEASTVGQPPPFLTAAASSALSPNKDNAYNPPDVQRVMLGIQTFSKSHWAPGDRTVVSTRGSAWYRANASDPGYATNVLADLVWFNLEATSELQGVAWDILPRLGDSRSAAAPNWSHDGTRVVYASTDTGAEDGRMGKGASDLFVVPYNNKQGGVATPVVGAADSSFEEYYPAFSADDSLIAFNRVRAGETMYNQPAAEVFVVPAKGGAAVRVAANDPVACSGKSSPGVQNTWPKWSPSALKGSDGKTYHWLVFSSTRGGARAQLYVSPVVQDSTGALKTYPAIYLWNQDTTLNNLVPAWDVFEIPPVVPR